MARHLKKCGAFFGCLAEHENGYKAQKFTVARQRAVFESCRLDHVGMDYAPFKIPSQMAGDFSYRFVIPLLRKKSRAA